MSVCTNFTSVRLVVVDMVDWQKNWLSHSTIHWAMSKNIYEKYDLVWPLKEPFDNFGKIIICYGKLRNHLTHNLPTKSKYVV